MSGFVRCDEQGCGWMRACPWDDMPSWHGVACPECGKGEIVSDEDMKMIRFIAAGRDLGIWRPDDGEGPGVTVRVDSLKLRGKL